MRENAILSLDVLPQHAPLWERMRYFLDKNEIPQALLFTGPTYTHILTFVRQWMARVACEGLSKPCGACQSCVKFIQYIHPDCLWIAPEKPGALIKIEQIRDLQQGVYQTPQCGNRRFVVIDEADQLNLSSANALLKVLEEPPSHTVFILIARSANALPITVRSRCQQFNFDIPLAFESSDYFMQASHYPSDSPRGIIFEARETMMTAFNDYIDGRQSCCQLALSWSKHALDDLLWFLYIMTSMNLRSSLGNEPGARSYCLLNQLDAIGRLMKKRMANIALNETLALESILLGYIEW